MGRKCSVENCLSDSNRQEDTGVTFHKVPHHPDLRPKWISLCRIPDDKTSVKVIYICSRHFLRADFCSFKGKKYMLRQGVLPSVFPWDKSKLEAIKAEASPKKGAEVPKKREKSKIIKKKDPEKLEKLSTPKTETPVKEKSETDIKIEPDDIKLESEEFPSESDIKHEVKDEIKEEGKEETDVFDEHIKRANASPGPSTSINFAINSRIEVLDNNNFWYTAKINEVDYEENEVLIHFEKFSTKYDEWISMNSPRLRPVQPKSLEKYVEGERCMATWSDSRKFPATVSKVLDNDSYEVLFDDGYVKTVKNHKMVKMHSSKPTQSSPLFDPVRGTKQERRDKKRKLNVAALFGKRARVSSSDEKKGKASPVVHFVEEPSMSPSQDESGAMPWHLTWENGRPLGVESTIESIDGLRKSVVVPDPRLPNGWVKHLAQRVHGSSAGKWDTVIVGPDNKRFRSRNDIKNYLDLHPEIGATLDMFDFSIYRQGYRKKAKTKQKLSFENQPGPEEVPEIPPVKEEVPEEPPISLKIIFENDGYKCPIEGCGKMFRRENLALMHVKHYHSEYTKYLDSTPNVADLAYARTVGENLDRSPGPSKPIMGKNPLERTSAAPKLAKAVQPGLDTKDAVSSDSPSILDAKLKDSEIIKLLNQKPCDRIDEIQPLPPGLPSNMYPDIKLKDLLNKTDDMPLRDELNLKSLCSSRPPHGIKTILPVRPAQPSSANEVSEEVKGGTKRKRGPTDIADANKGKNLHQPPPSALSEAPHQQPQHQQNLPQHQQQPIHQNQSPTSKSLPSYPTLPSAYDLAPPPMGLDTSQPPPTVAQFDGVIIEGGRIIKLERMKQEEIINCTCGFIEEDGLMIQCELCLCWQHAYCNNIQKESEVPEKYVCYICQHPLRERRSMKYLHDQDWLKQGALPVASYHSKNEHDLHTRFEKLKKCHDLSGGLLELREYMHTLAFKLKIAEAKNHPKLYLWSKPWEKPKLPEKSTVKNEPDADIKPKLENIDHQYVKNELDVEKQESQGESMLMMILKAGKEDLPMLNMHNSMAPIIPQPEAAIDSDDCRLNLLDHIAHAESLIEERLDDFEKQIEALEEGSNVETEDNYPKTRQTLQLLMRDLETLKRFSEVPMI